MVETKVRDCDDIFFYVNSMWVNIKKTFLILTHILFTSKNISLQSLTEQKVCTSEKDH